MPGGDAAVDAGPPPPHVAAWFRCVDELCYDIADDGFELLRDGTAKELRAVRDEDDAGVPWGEVGFSAWCEMPWGRYEFDGVNFVIDPDDPAAETAEALFDVRRSIGTFLYDDLSHTHYYRVEGDAIGACPAGTARGLVRVTDALGSMPAL